MHSKFYLSFICMAFVMLPVQAKKVEVDKAEKLAQGFIQSKQQFRSATSLSLKYAATKSQEMLKSAPATGVLQTTGQDTVYYYVFNTNENTGGGFVIVSGDDAITPVLGYSDKGNYDENNLPPNFAWWMDEIQRQITYAQSHNLTQSDAVKNEWDSYLKGTATATASAAGPLIQTHWDQTSPYNNLCPTSHGTATYTGCVATAMAQIMKYHNCPTTGTGNSTAYTTTSGIKVPAVNFNVTYDWANMQNTYTGSETTQQKNAVATLMYHCGASVSMDYDIIGSSGSGASVFDVPQALTKYFGYDKSIQINFRDGFNDSDWESLLQTQIDAGLPVFYTGSGSEGGHAFVCDGYDNTGMFHFNWGWSGWYDGYFVTSVLNPGGIDFNTSQSIVTNIKPNAGGVASYNLALYDQFSASANNLTSNQSFTVSASVVNIGLVSFPGNDLGVALVNSNDQIVELVGRASTGGQLPSFYYTVLNFNCTVSNNVAAGQYKLMLVDIPTTGDMKIIANTMGCPNSIDVILNLVSIDITADFTDPNFRAAVYALIGKIAPKPIYDIDVKSITDLDVSNKSIQSLAGLEHFLGLTSLNCSNNHLTNLDVSKNTELTSLNCNNNAIPLIKLYTLAQQAANFANKSLGGQNLPDSTVYVNAPIAIDTVFYGVNTICNYPLDNGKITFSTPGDYSVTLSNPALLDGSVHQTFHVQAMPTYGVSIGTFTGGSVSTDKTAAAAGETVTLTISPDTGYELNVISAYKTGDQATNVTLSGSGATRTFTMPEYGVTVTATFKTADQLAVETAKSAIESASYSLAQTTANTEVAVKVWLIAQIDTLIASSGITVSPANITIRNFTAATAGTTSNTSGTNGSFPFNVSLTKGSSSLTTVVKTGVIIATPFTIVKSIKLMQPDELTVRVTNTGNVATGELTLTLSGANANVFTLSSNLIDDLAAGEKMDIALTPSADLAEGTYTATLTVSGDGIESQSVNVSYKATKTGVENVNQVNSLVAWVQNGSLHVSGLTIGKSWSVYNVSGSVVHQSIANSEQADIPLTVRGVYFVQSGKQVIKSFYK